MSDFGGVHRVSLFVPYAIFVFKGEHGISPTRMQAG